MTRFFGRPKQFDIVYGRFPYREHPKQPAPKPHPCLVLDVSEDEEGNPWVVVSMGTSVDWNKSSAGEFRVQPSDGAPFGKTKLAHPTKFGLSRDRLAKLPYNDDWFDVPPERRPEGQNHPKIGTLDWTHYGAAAAKAGGAVDVTTSLKELADQDVGSLPPK